MSHILFRGDSDSKEHFVPWSPFIILGAQEAKIKLMEILSHFKRNIDWED